MGRCPLGTGASTAVHGAFATAGMDAAIAVLGELRGWKGPPRFYSGILS